MKSEQYRLIPEERRPKLMSKNIVLKQVDGTKVQIDGVASMNLRVGGCVLQVQVYVAPVSDNLLGLNFLPKAGAMIDLDKLQLVIGSQRIDCRTRDDKPLYARIVADCDIRVPGEHELVISDGITSDWGGKLGVVEPIDRGMLIEHGLLVARGLVETESTSVPLKIMNVREEYVIKEGTVLAKMFPVREDDVQAMRAAKSPVEIKPELPEHLCDLLERCSEGLTEDEILEVIY